MKTIEEQIKYYKKAIIPLLIFFVLSLIVIAYDHIL